MDIYIMRGIPGSGKSTEAKKIAANYKNSIIVSADHFFEKSGKYIFNARLLGAAHKACIDAFHAAIEDFGVDCIIVDNTNIKASDMKPYIDECRLVSDISGIELIPKIVTVKCDVETAFVRQTHVVPRETIQRMHDNLFAKSGQRTYPSSAVFGNAATYRTIDAI